MAVPFGFFGKLPARGDFVLSGLPRGFVSSWDVWLRRVLPAVLGSMSDGWDGAPAWWFRLPAGVCGADPVAGVVLPSRDSVGRRFPLTVASVMPSVDDTCLIAAEQLGRAAIEHRWPPERLAQPAAGIATCSDTESGKTDGQHRFLADLPDAAMLITMLTKDDRQSHEC